MEGRKKEKMSVREERREGKEKDEEEAEKQRTQALIDKQKKRKKNSNMYIIGVSEKENWSNEIGQMLKYIKKKKIFNNKRILSSYREGTVFPEYNDFEYLVLRNY